MTQSTTRIHTIINEHLYWINQFKLVQALKENNQYHIQIEITVTLTNNQTVEQH